MDDRFQACMNGQLRVCGFEPATLATALALAFACGSGQAQTTPSGGVAVHGQASISTPAANQLKVVTQNGAGTSHSAINWQSFSIAPGAMTTFVQPSPGSVSINRVVTNTPSSIFGSLSSNGHLVLVNPSGIAVGAGAVIDTAGFTASALRMGDADALAGRLRFGTAGAAAGAATAISVGGRITARNGDVVLVAPNIDIGASALLQAPNGSTILAAGQQVEITGRGLEGVTLLVQAPADQVRNLGRLEGNAAAIFAGTLRHSGEIQATTASLEGGTVVLKASGDAYVEGAGTVMATGTRGGSVDLLGNRVAVMDQAVIDVSGTLGGGSIRIGGDYQGKNADLPNAYRTYLGPAATLRADALQLGDGGRVIVWADDLTKAYGTVSARGGLLGGNGGFVEVSGRHNLVFEARVDLRAPSGALGTLLLDPDFINIANVGGDPVASGDAFADGSGSVVISPLALDAVGGNVMLQSNGDITFSDPVTLATVGASLTALAGNLIQVDAPITTNGGDILLYAGAPGASGTGTSGNTSVDVGAAITSNGGAITLQGGSNTLSTAIYIHAPVNAAAGTIVLTGVGDVVQGVEALTGATLLVTSGSNIDLTAQNNISSNVSLSTDINTFDQGLIQFNNTAANFNLTGATAKGGIYITASGHVTTSGALFSLLSDVVIRAPDGIVIGGDIDAAGNLSLYSNTGSTATIGQTAGVVTVGGSALLSAGPGGTGDISFPSSGNNFNDISVIGGNITVVDTNALTVTALTRNLPGGNLTLDAGTGLLNLPAGNINTGGGDLRLLAGGAFVTPGNLSGGIVELRGSGGLTLGDDITATGTLTLTTGPSGFIDQTFGSIVVAGATSANAGSQPIALTGATNDFNSFSATGGVISVRDTNAIVLDGINAGTSLTMQANGNVTQSAALVVGGSTTVSAGVGNVVLNTAGNNLNSLSVSGAAIDIVDGAGNSLTVTALSSAANQPVSIVAGDTLTLPAAPINTGTASLTLASLAGPLVVAGSLNGSDITLSSGTTLDLATTVDAMITLTLNAPGGVTQSGGVIGAVAGLVVNAGASDVSLTRPGNSFPNLSVTGGAVTVVDGSFLAINALVSGTNKAVNISAGGSLTAAATINTGSAPLTLSSLAGPLVVAANLNGGDITLNSATTLDLATNVDAMITLALNAPGGVSQSAGVIGAGAQVVVNAGANDVSLARPGNSFPNLSVTGGAVTVVDGSYLAVNTLVSGTNKAVNISSGGNLTLPATPISTGTANLTLASVIGSLVVPAALSGATVNLSAGTTMAINANITSGDLFLTAGDAITQGGGAILAGLFTVINAHAGPNNAGNARAITLTGSGNDFNRISTNGGPVSLVDTNTVELASSNVFGAYSVSATGTIIQQPSSDLQITGTATLRSVAGDIIVTQPGNNIAGLDLGGNTITVANGGSATSVSVAGSNNNPVNVSSGGPLTVLPGGPLGTANVTFASTAGGLTVAGDISAGVVNLSAGATMTLNANIQTLTDLNLGSGGAITQGAGAITVAGLTTINAAGASPVTLLGGNDFNTLTATSGALSVSDSNHLVVSAAGINSANGNVDLSANGIGSLTLNGPINAGSGNVTLYAHGTVTEAGAGAVTGSTLTVNSSLAALTLNGPNNVSAARFSTAGGGTVNFNNLNPAFALSGTGGSLTVTGAGHTTVDQALNFASGIDITSSTGITLSADVTPGANLVLTTSSGLIEQIGAGTLFANSGTATFNAGTGDISLNAPTNQFNVVNLSGGHIFVVASDGLIVNALVSGANQNVFLDARGSSGLLLPGTPINAGTGQITLGSAGALFFGGALTGSDILLSGQTGVTVGANIAASGFLMVDASTGGVTQSPGTAISVLGPTTVSVGTGGITLAQPGNDFSSIALTGDVVTVHDANGLSFGAVNVSTSLTLLTSGNVTQTAPVSVGGSTTLDAGSGNVTLTTAGNSFGNLSVSGGAISIVASGSPLNVSSLASGPNQSVSLVTGSTLTLPGSAIDTGSGDLTLASGSGPFSLPGALRGNNVNVTAATALAVNTPVSATGKLALTGSSLAISSAVSGAEVDLHGTSGVSLTGAAVVSASAGSGNSLQVRVDSGAFSNTSSAGAGALTAAPGGRWLVYSVDPASDTRGGLAFDFKQYGALPGDPVLGAGNGVLFSLVPTASASLTGTFSKIYDGDMTVPLTAANYTVTGIDGDVLVLNSATAGAFDNKNVGTGKVITIGGLSVASASNGAAAVFGYNTVVDQGAGGLTGSITAAELVVSTSPVSKVYDGTTSAAGTAVVRSGTLFTGDTLSGGSFAFLDKHAGTGKSVAVSAVSVNDGNGGANYTLSFVNNTASTITPASLTLGSNAVNRVYDGTTAAVGSVVVSGGTLFAGDTLSGGSFAFLDKHVGTGKTVAVSGASVNDGNGGGNYKLSFANNAASSISAAPLTIGFNTVDKTYDGNTSAAGTPVVSSGTLFAGDTLNGGGFVFADKNVGTNKVVSATGLAISDGNGGANYSVSFAANLTGSINPLASVGWTGSAGDNLWSSAGNWAGGAIPDGANVVAVTVGTGSGPVNHDVPGVNIQSLTSTRPVNQSGGGSFTTGALTLSTTQGITLDNPANQIATLGATNNGSGDIMIRNTGALNVTGLVNTGGSITLNNTGAVVTSGLVSALAVNITPPASVAITANSPLTIGSAGVEAAGDITLTATDLTSPGNMVLDGPVRSGAKVLIVAANNLLQNSAVVGATGVAARAGGAITLGPLATTDGATVAYSVGGLAVTPPVPGAPVRPERPTDDAVQEEMVKQTDTIATFLTLFEKAVEEQNQTDPTDTNPDGSKKKKATEDTIVTEGEICR